MRKYKLRKRIFYIAVVLIALPLYAQEPSPLSVPPRTFITNDKGETYEVYNPYEGLILARNTHSNYGFLDTSLAEVIPFLYKETYSFNKGRAYVIQDNQSF